MVFAVLIVALLAFSILQIAGGTSGDGPTRVGDHWHAALGVDVCGSFLDNAPPFEDRAGTETRAGLHSHGDGLMHIHPFAEDESGDSATVGRYFEYGGGRLTGDRIVAWQDTDVANGDACPDGTPGLVRWALNGVEQEGDPARYAPQDGDVITIAFLPAGSPIPDPPSKATLPNPIDEQ